MKFRELLEDEVIKFYKDNPTEYMGEDAAYMADNVSFFGVINNDSIIASTSYKRYTDNLVMIQSTMVIDGYRGQGVGRFLNAQLEKHFKEKGFGKIVSHIYVQNLPSIILKLKLGYLVEGTLRDHDFKGQHEYVLGKQL